MLRAYYSSKSWAKAGTVNEKKVSKISIDQTNLNKGRAREKKKKHVETR
jgi:hypothetical protein